MREDGFSLVELIIAMAIGLVVLFAMYNVFTLHNKTHTEQQRINDMQHNARAGLHKMAQEIRMAGTGVLSDILAGTGIPKCTGTSPSATYCRGIVSAAERSITFTAGDPTVQIQYQLQNNPTNFPVPGPGVSLLRNGKAVAENITSLQFTYNDIGGNAMNPVSNLENIKEIVITVISTTSKPDPETGRYRAYTLTTKVNPRNLNY